MTFHDQDQYKPGREPPPITLSEWTIIVGAVLLFVVIVAGAVWVFGS